MIYEQEGRGFKLSVAQHHGIDELFAINSKHGSYRVMLRKLSEFINLSMYPENGVLFGAVFVISFFFFFSIFLYTSH